MKTLHHCVSIEIIFQQSRLWIEQSLNIKGAVSWDAHVQDSRTFKLEKGPHYCPH